MNSRHRRCCGKKCCEKKYSGKKSSSNRLLSRRVCLLLLCSLSVISQAATDTSRIEQVKAAVLFNTTKFVTWPTTVFQDKSKPVNLCFYNRDILQNGFNSIRKKTVAGRSIEKSLIHNLESSKKCQIILVPSEQLSHFRKNIGPYSQYPILTIVDLTDVKTQPKPYNGIVVAWVRNKSRIEFQVNLENASQRGLKIGSELLKLAKIVGGEGE